MATPTYGGWPRLDVAHLIGTLTETLLLGHFLGLLFRMTETMVLRSKGTKDMLKSPLLWVALLITMAILGSWITAVALAFQAFAPHSDTAYLSRAEVGGDKLPSVVHYLTVDNPFNVANTAFYLINTFVCDAFIIYRLHIVWYRRWWIIFPPLLMLLGLAVAGSMAISSISHSSELSLRPGAGAWVIACFTLTLACNIYSTTLIVWRIHISDRNVRISGTEKLGHGQHQNVADLLIQGASLYTALLTISLLTYVLHSNLVFISTAATNPVIGIIFCMIVMRAQRTAKACSGASSASSNRTHRAIKIVTEFEKHVTVDPHDPSAIEEVDVAEGSLRRPAKSKICRSPSRARRYPFAGDGGNVHWPMESHIADREFRGSMV